MRRRGAGAYPPPHRSASHFEGCDSMLTWLSANLINIALVAVLVLIVGLLLRGMIRDKKAGKSSCGCNCASCGACSGCSACAHCGSMKGTAMQDRSGNVRVSTSE